MTAARRLAESTGEKGRRVTSAGALSPAEVPEAAAALGLLMKPPVRRAADLPEVHQGWLMAVANGMVKITSGRARAGNDTTAWNDAEAEMDDERLLAGWLEGLRLICTDLSANQYPETLKWLILLTLELLPDGTTEKSSPPFDVSRLRYQVSQALRQEDGLRDAVEHRREHTWLDQNSSGSEWKLFALLANAGLVRGTTSKPEVTVLGCWLARRLRAEAPVQIGPEWPAATVLAHLRAAGPDADLRRLSHGWRWARKPEEAMVELVSTAAGTDAATRSVAVRLASHYGEAALPAWNTVLDTTDLGPHAREMLSWWEQGPGPRAGDRWWLGVEWAAAALVDIGPDEALCYLADTPVSESGVDPVPGDPARAQALIAAIPGSGHPQAQQVAQTLTDFLASGALRSIDHQLQVTVRLTGWRPATWRRVLLPATDSLGSLSWAISVLFGWGIDHLHVFQVGRRRFSDPAFPLDEAGDEDDVRLSRLFAAGERKLTYTYDLGAGWEHEIVLEKLTPKDAGQPGVRCLAFAGDSPLEYPELYDEEDGTEIAEPVLTRPFDLDKVNAVLASQVYEVDAE
jgi:hypothetical protein